MEEFLMSIITIFERSLSWISRGHKLTHNETGRQNPSFILKKDSQQCWNYHEITSCNFKILKIDVEYKWYNIWLESKH